MEENTIKINGLEYVLIDKHDNSAPCAECAFFDRNTLACIHPDFPNRHCEQNPGTRRGWNTKEYKAKDYQAHHCWKKGRKHV